MKNFKYQHNFNICKLITVVGSDTGITDKNPTEIRCCASPRQLFLTTPSKLNVQRATVGNVKPLLLHQDKTHFEWNSIRGQLQLKSQYWSSVQSSAVYAITLKKNMQKYILRHHGTAMRWYLVINTLCFNINPKCQWNN